jgi:hypothetical protein
VTTRKKTVGQKACDRWNRLHRIGDWVLYRLGRDCEPARLQTRSSAWCIDSGEVVVGLVGINGGVLVDCLEEPDEARQEEDEEDTE